MNFVNRHFPDREVTDSISPEPRISREPKWPLRYEAVEHVVLGADIATILFASIVSTLLYQAQNGQAAANFGNALGLALVGAVCLVCLLKAYGLYQPVELLVLRNQIRAVCLAWMSSVLFMLAVFGFAIDPEISQHRGLLFAVLALGLLLGERWGVKVLLGRALSGRKFASTNIVLISDQPLSKNAGLSETLSMHGYLVKERFSLPPFGFGPACRRRLTTRVIDYIRNCQLDQVVVEAEPERWPELRAFVADLRVLPFPIIFVPVGTTSELLRHPRRSLGGAVCLELQQGPLTPLEYAIKRTIDVIGAGLALVMLAPLLALAAIAIKLESPGPVFFRQQRCGFNGRTFLISKFRTMHVLEDGHVIAQATPQDRRVTRVGRLLRRTSFDELPQLLNVLEGSMSLVGPRPHALAHDGQFDKLVRNYAFRRRVRPGLTGWAQVHGCRGATPTASMIEARVQYDLWYIDNWSIRLDLAILLRTPMEVLRGRNAY
ncbi:exopolysaccharide biosynthesis polyprenyl glycosylphosphotransferase [Bradyrhizobium centrosematis]|uniref:exopolysaccharide biosynthesis polyprenyl glycosylphosphotransferase n=1 Tax=Bradyrhizobium centrosematis TaxID=1300039 RepID=UPI002166E0CE|nr:exopolysaccharide biosynthesis polyprenyl glycosylphosphotransferase [Bradyrhizobium centrosematis]MCS3758993.1 putative colanic acid biosynthesis UDP-glucose lipid carrier transferase [Bradyrhizobium centrosematis]MCS3773119.1 putative colanic acid biosynthesis UDP-glucose lipid carrier transferase [Bradyrhizobium centrosematis]